MQQEFYAHSVDGKPVSEWHKLEEHQKGMAERSADMAKEFGCGEWGRLAEVKEKKLKELLLEQGACNFPPQIG